MSGYSDEERDWRYEVANGDTQLGYADWLVAQRLSTPPYDTAPYVEKVWVERKLLMSLLEPLRLARVYVLMGSEFEEDIGDDFKPWKWYGTEMLFADSCTAAYRLVMDALTADPQPPDGWDKSSSPRS